MWTRNALIGALLITATEARGQISSTLQSINLVATKNQSVSVSAPTPSTQTVTLIDGQPNVYPAPFTTTVAWDVHNSATTTVKLVAYFGTPSAAMTNGSDLIASSLIEVSTDGGTTWHPLTGNAVAGVGSAGGSYVVYTSPVTSGTNKKSSTTVTFSVRVNLTGTNTPSGTYSGTMNLMAICS